MYLVSCILPQGCTSVTEITSCNANLVPYVLIIGDLDDPTQAFLVVDRQVVTEVDIINIPLVLMSAFLFLIFVTLKVVVTFTLSWRLIPLVFLWPKRQLL